MSFVLIYSEKYDIIILTGENRHSVYKNPSSEEISPYPHAASMHKSLGIDILPFIKEADELSIGSAEFLTAIIINKLRSVQDPKPWRYADTLSRMTCFYYGIRLYFHRAGDC